MTPTIAERVAQLESTVGTLKQTMEKVELHMIRANTYFDRAEGAMDSQDEAKKLGVQKASPQRLLRNSSAQSLRATKELLPFNAATKSEIETLGGYSTAKCA